MDDPAITLEDVRVSFGPVQALDGLSLEVNRGDMFGLVGPDGSGKTTTIRLLCGLLDADAGSAHVLGHSLPREKRAIRDRIGYLSQRFSLYEDLSIDENIAFFATLHQVADFRRRRDELLAFTRLTPFRDRHAGKLSGGMKQKLALACTLIHRPELILLDEPTTGVDPVARRDFWKILADIRRSGVTILLSTPYLDEAERCSRVALVHDGRAIISGSPDDIRGVVSGSVFEVVTPRAREANRVLGAMADPPAIQLFGDRLHVILPSNRPFAGVLHALEEDSIPVTQARQIRPTLENAYIALVERAHANLHDS